MSFIFILSFLCASSLVAVGAPVERALDDQTLLANGQLAQSLNAQFTTLKTTDTCNVRATACIDGQEARCLDDESGWDTQACPQSQSCFALPNLREEGIFLTCTSEQNALSVIAASGAQGGIAVANQNGTANSTTMDSQDGTSSNSTTTDSGVDQAQGAGATVTVTITTTIASAPTIETSAGVGNATATGSVVASSALTTTVDQAEASSIIASATANGGEVVTIQTGAPEPSATAPPAGAAQGQAQGDAAGQEGSAAPPSRTITLTP